MLTFCNTFRRAVAARVVLGAVAALAIALAAPQASAHAAVAGHFRYAIGTDASFPDISATGRRMNYVVLHSWQQDRLRALKAANPRVKVLVY